jgi:hypothetical protein
VVAISMGLEMMLNHAQSNGLEIVHQGTLAPE